MAEENANHINGGPLLSRCKKGVEAVEEKKPKTVWVKKEGRSGTG
jgi:hypothetical protein